MKILDLFSGIGGFSLAADWLGWETVAFCEREPFPRKVLAKHWPNVPIHDDVKKLEEFTQYARTVDLICGGYPCQPFSVAGKQRGAEDDRHLWPEMFEIIKAVRPRWIVAENVAGHVRMGLDSVLSDLESEGYTTQSLIIPACAVNAKHRRDRVWIIAHANSERRQKHNFSKIMYNLGQCTGGNNEKAKHNRPGIKPGICRGIDGIPPGLDRDIKILNRNARVKALGNAIVPQVAYRIFKAIEAADALAGRYGTEVYFGGQKKT